jgi:N-acetylmuramoyl-L-alanine amidase
MRAGVFRASRTVKVAGVLFAAVCVLGFGAVRMASASSNSGILKVRLGGDAAETRLVLDLDRSVSAKIVQDGSEGRRIIMALGGMDIPAGLDGAGQGLVRRWSVDRKGGSAQLNIDLAADAEVRRRFLLPPGDGVPNYRYEIDLKATGQAPAPTAKAPTATPRVMVVNTAPRRMKRVIVIDAGHGGKDPGAKGAENQEKALTLAAARALKARLEKSGRYKVVMTRDSDVFVPLEQRVRIARKADADLFISLHADAGPSAETRGLSVYTLSDKGAERSTRIMAKDEWLMNASYNGSNRTVGQILLDLTQRSTKNRSAQFAEALLECVSDETTLLRRSHRDAGFMVLLAPEVPAVLLEMGFVTNSKDEKLLASASGRNRLMNAVGDSIDGYFAEQTRLAAR